MTHTPELLRVIEQNELDKTSRCVRLVDSNGVFALAVDEKYGGLVAAAPDMLEALEEVVALTENLQVCPFCGCVLDHRPDCLSREIESAIRKARGERHCHSEYGSANCKWEPGRGCTPKCPECN